MIMQDNEKKPALRFKGFTDPWEQRKLGEIAKEVVRNDPASDAPIMMITAGNGFIEQSDRYAFNNAGESLKKYILLERGELAYNHGASKLRPYGSCFALTTVEKARIPFVYHCFSVEKSNPEFLSIELNGANVENQLRKIVSSGARMDGLLNIAYSEYTEVTVQLPKKEEQDWIAKFFKHLDTLITLHQRKYEKLVNIKKSMLDKMFPPNGASVPEIRFKGFTDPWEQRKLKELYFQLTERNADLLPYQKTLSVATMSFKTDGNGAADTSLANYKRLRTGDIAFEGHTSKEFRYGRFVLNDVGDGIMSPRFSALRPLHEMPINFWKYYIHYEPIMRKVLVNSTKAGTMMNELVINEFLQESILVPSVAEQQAIGRFFKQLDTLITLHQRKLEKLQNIKKSCLEKMFA